MTSLCEECPETFSHLEAFSKHTAVGADFLVLEGPDSSGRIKPGVTTSNCCMSEEIAAMEVDASVWVSSAVLDCW